MLSVRRSFICLFGLLCSNTSVLSQQQVFPLANAGPEAVYVTLGTYLPCGGSSPVALYTVERREAAGWMNLGEVRMPASQDELADGIANAHVHLPHLHPPRSGLITSLWRTAVRTGRLDSLGFWGTSPLVQVALGAMFVDNSVEAGTYYEYRVTEVRVDGKQGRTIRSRPVRMPARPYPEKLRSIESEKTTSGFTLRWLINGSPPPAALHLFRQENVQGEFRQVSATVGFQQSGGIVTAVVEDTTLSSAVILSYYALPIDLLGNPGVPSDTLMVGTYDFRSTAAFTEIRTQSMDSIGGIRIAWRLSDARFVSTVQVQRSSKWDGTYSTLTELPSSDTSFTDQTTQPMAEYFYRLLTTGPLGELSEPSARVYGLFQSSESPLPPVEVFATGIQNGVRIEWKNPDDHIAGVYLYRMGGGSDSLSLLTPLLPLSGKRNVYVDSSGLSGRHVYGYALRSENTSHVWSSLSDTVYARPQIPTNPLAPMEFSVSLDGTTARLFWMDMPLLDETVEGYILSRREVSGGKRKPGPFRPLHDTLLTRNYATDSLERGRMYEFAIQSVDAFGGRSDLIASNVVSVERTNSPPPQGIRVTPIRTGILVKWDLPSGDGVTSLRLYRYERGRAATRLAELKATAEEFTDRKAAKGVLYFYYLTSVSIDGSESPASEDAGGRR